MSPFEGKNDQIRSISFLHTGSIILSAMPTIDTHIPPAMLPRMGELITNQAYRRKVENPFCVELIGMPDTGKTTCLDRYVRNNADRNGSPHIHVIREGADDIKSRFGELRISDPAQYVHLTALLTRFRYVDALTTHRPVPHVIVADRGLTDGMIFQQVNETRGRRLLPDKADDYDCAQRLAESPVDRVGVIMFLARADQSFARAKRTLDRSFFDDLYLQYLKFHAEHISGQSRLPFYACIDAEQDHNKVYKEFSRALDAMIL